LAERKLLHLRRDDSCSSCALHLAAGTQAYWLKPERVVLCIGCGSLPDSPEVRSVAGGSARREHERRRQNREDRARAQYGRIGGWAAQLSSGPQHERAWSRGAQGEEENARRFQRLLANKGVELLHDRGWPGRQANIDHIAIGPGGVTVIDSKKLSGKIKVDWRGDLFKEREYDLYVGRRKRTNLVEGIEAQVELVRSVLVAEGLADVSVRGALCMADTEGLPLLRQLSLRDIVINGPRHVAKLAARPGPLSLETVKQVTAVLARRLPPT
jgi:Nuclease-related domain